MASASYWIAQQTPHGEVLQWMWNCESCPAAGLATSEPDVVRDMNAHQAEAHPDAGYAAPPIPE